MADVDLGNGGAKVPEASGPNEPSGADATYHGFLFADLRGYTAFAERHGDRAAADLLEAFRNLVREEVARHAGAEIRTEGDSFYVVFPSARRAVACGLAIVAAAERHTRDNPEQPIRLGIGINAGETVQRGEGYVGTAVNLAARVCSQAAAGEVLVTGTVRDAARGASDAHFEFRGRRRLKGIADAVPLFAVTATSPAGRVTGWPTLLEGLRRTRWVAIPLLLAGVVAGALLVRAALPPAAFGPLPAASALVLVETSRAEATSGASTSISLEPDAYPNAAEASVLSRLDPATVDSCERADPDDRPRLNVDRALAGLGGTGRTRAPIPVSAGVACTIPSVAAPNAVSYWSPSPWLDFNSVNLAEAVVPSDAGSFRIPSGDCASQVPAYGRCEFGGNGGWLLCRTSYGDAILVWNYDGEAIVGIAVRRDGDFPKLLDWWRNEARSLKS